MRQQRPPGPLQAFVGPRIGAQELADCERYEGYPREQLERLAAWTLLPLVGASFEVDSVSAIAAAVRALLAKKLPGLDWWVPDSWSGPFEKYGLLHRSLPAPPNPATGEAMALEVFGSAERVIEVGSDEWCDRRRAQQLGLDAGDHGRLYDLVGVRLPTRVVIEVATYANIVLPGVRVPLYL